MTPDTSCILRPEFTDVYPPSEDSFLFLDALEKDASFLNSLKVDISLEVGSGSGIISSFFNSIRKTHRFHICTDTNPTACLATKNVITSNNPARCITYDIINCSLTGPLIPNLLRSVDLILFNPPYVTTPEEEHEHVGVSISAAWSGGRLGRQVVDAFLPEAVRLLSPKGCIYLLLSDENHPEEVHRLVYSLTDGRLSVRTVIRRRANNESLGVYCYGDFKLIDSNTQSPCIDLLLTNKSLS